MIILSFYASNHYDPIWEYNVQPRTFLGNNAILYDLEFLILFSSVPYDLDVIVLKLWFQKKK